MRQAKNNGMLLLAAFIWGCAFVAQSVGMDYVGPFTFNAVRNYIGALVLVPVMFLMDALKRREGTGEAGTASPCKDQRTLVVGGMVCGAVLAVASTLQQFGILYTTVGKAGFITAMYIVLVPIFGIFLGRKVRPLVIACVVIAVAGLYFLCMTESFSIGRGDFLVLLCALCFTGHILAVDYFSPLVDGVRMSAIQFLTAAVLCTVPMLAFERPQISDIMSAWMPILYAGALSSGAGYTLQVLGQKGANPAVASLILSLESVFSVLAGWVLLGQALSARELLGCALMFGAIVLAQLPQKN